MILVFLSAIFASTHAAYNISVYGDVHTDVEFFTRTFPWIIDNIGGEIIVDYYILGSGRYSVPQMCALKDLKRNTFLQAQYLKCEAEGNSSAYCLCEAGIDPQTFKQCVASGGSLAGSAAAEFSKLGINFTPIIELEPRSTVFGVEDIWFLMKICTIFGDNLPRGCINYSNQTDSFPEKKALAQFDRACHEEFPISCNDEKPVTTTTATPPWWSTPSTPTTPLWSTTSPPWWSTTPLPWWSTTSPPWWLTTQTPWQTTSTPTPWLTTPWWQTSPAPYPSPEGQTTPSPDWQTTPSPDWLTTPTPDWQTTPSPNWQRTQNARLADDANDGGFDDPDTVLADVGNALD